MWKKLCMNSIRLAKLPSHLHFRSSEALTRKERSYRRSFLIEKLKLKENTQLACDPELLEQVVRVF